MPVPGGGLVSAMTWRVVSPRAVRGAQFMTLLVSLTYGLRFVLPVGASRSPIYEYINTMHTPMWFWGCLITLSCLAGFISEGFLHRRYRRGLVWVPLMAHSLLAAVFLTIGLAALKYNFDVQVSGDVGPWSWPEFLGAGQRPAQYWFIGYMHAMFARRVDVAKAVVA